MSRVVYVLVRVTGCKGSVWTWVVTDGPFPDGWEVIARGSHDACQAAYRLVDEPARPDGCEVPR